MLDDKNIQVLIQDRVKIRKVSVLQVRKLRALILRPDRTPEMMAYLGDYAPDTLHLGAFQEDKLVGIVTFIHQAPPDFSGNIADLIWLLRGMGTLPDVRGQGYGAALVRTGCAYVARENGTHVWCNGRESAAGFYKKLGFTIKGNLFDLPETGLHYRMWHEITSSDSTYSPF